MKKKWSTLIIVGVMVIAGITALLVNYKTDTLSPPVICTSVNENGACTGISKSFTSDVKQVIFVCQRKKPFVLKATITWYSDSNNNKPIKKETVTVNNAGYFISTFSRTEGMAAGDYHVYIDVTYALGSSKAVANYTVQ